MMPDTNSYLYNDRSELTSARRTKDGQSIPGFSEDFDYDPIGNRRSSSTYNEKGEAQTSNYEANRLNQYSSRTTPLMGTNVNGQSHCDLAIRFETSSRHSCLSAVCDRFTQSQ